LADIEAEAIPRPYRAASGRRDQTRHIALLLPLARRASSLCILHKLAMSGGPRHIGGARHSRPVRTGGSSKSMNWSIVIRFMGAMTGGGSGSAGRIGARHASDR